MAQVYGVDGKRFLDRGYLYQEPTERECHEMGWSSANIPPTESGYNSEVRTWIRETFWCRDYVIGQYGRVWFKYKRDLFLFKLRWS